jgi:hypothetical protein
MRIELPRHSEPSMSIHLRHPHHLAAATPEFVARQMRHSLIRYAQTDLEPKSVLPVETVSAIFAPASPTRSSVSGRNDRMNNIIHAAPAVN